MDVEAIWHTHKPFILKVLGGALVFLILSSFRSGLAEDAAKLAKTNATQEAAILDKLSQLKGAEGLEKGRADALENKLAPSLLKTITWEVGPSYQLPEGHSSPELFYDSARRNAAKFVKRHAEQFNARVPGNSEGLGLVESPPEHTLVEMLARADLVSRTVTALLDQGVRTISAVDPREAEYDPRQGDDRFLRTLPIKLDFEATVPQLGKVIRALQRQGAFLEVVSTHLRRLDSGKLGVQLSLQALTLVDAAPKDRVRKQESRSQGRRVRHYGRER